MEMSRKEMEKVKFFCRYNRFNKFFFGFLFLIFLVSFIFNVFAIVRLTSSHDIPAGQIAKLIQPATAETQVSWYEAHITARIAYALMSILGMAIIAIFFMVIRTQLCTAVTSYLELKRFEDMEKKIYPESEEKYSDD